jgi:hypothetical protein
VAKESESPVALLEPFQGKKRKVNYKRRMDNVIHREAKKARTLCVSFSLSSNFLLIVLIQTS